jgi:RNA polymerase sigma factor (TIGR02999 family)
MDKKQTVNESVEVTELLQAWQGGDDSALEQLTPLVHAELHRLARHYMAGERKGHTLQATALINEAWVRLIDWHTVNWKNRAHFLGVSAQLMRHVLVDYARSRAHGKLQAGASQVSFGQLEIPPDRPTDLVALDDALNSLARLDPRKGKIVELRFFGGLTVEEAAEVLQISSKTVQREWEKARAWLSHELLAEDPQLK